MLISLLVSPFFIPGISWLFKALDVWGKALRVMSCLVGTYAVLLIPLYLLQHPSLHPVFACLLIHSFIHSLLSSAKKLVANRWILVTTVTHILPHLGMGVLEEVRDGGGVRPTLEQHTWCFRDGIWSWMPCLKNPALPLPSCTSLGQPFHFSESQLPPLYNADNKCAHLMEFCEELMRRLEDT